MQRIFRALAAFLDQLDDLLEPMQKLAVTPDSNSFPYVYVLRRPSIANTLVQKALARCHDGALVPQTRQCDGHFLLVAAAHAVCDDIYLVAGAQEVDGGLRDADVAFNADDDAGEWPGGVEIVEGFLDFGGAARC